jgi:hypothetical protein
VGSVISITVTAGLITASLMVISVFEILAVAMLPPVADGGQSSCRSENWSKRLRKSIRQEWNVSDLNGLPREIFREQPDLFPHAVVIRGPSRQIRGPLFAFSHGHVSSLRSNGHSEITLDFSEAPVMQMFRRLTIALLPAALSFLSGPAAHARQTPYPLPETARIWPGRAAELEDYLRMAEVIKMEGVSVGVTKPRRAYLKPRGPFDSLVWKPISTAPEEAGRTNRQARQENGADTVFLTYPAARQETSLAEPPYSVVVPDTDFVKVPLA